VYLDDHIALPHTPEINEPGFRHWAVSLASSMYKAGVAIHAIWPIGRKLLQVFHSTHS